MFYVYGRSKFIEAKNNMGLAQYEVSNNEAVKITSFQIIQFLLKIFFYVLPSSIHCALIWIWQLLYGLLELQ